MKIKSSYALIGAALLAALGPAGVAGAPEQSAAANPGEPIPVLEALAKGVIELRLEGRAKAAYVVCHRGRTQTAGAVSIALPAGVTRLGFINDGGIRMAGRSWTQNFGEVRTLQHFVVLGSDNLESPGLSLQLEKDLLITIPEKESEKGETVSGAVKVAVPDGFMGCSLAGITGSVVDGSFNIERNDSTDAKDPKFRITYGDLKVSTK